MRDQRQLRAIYADIIAGYSRATLLGKTAYLRHITPTTQGYLDASFLSHMEKMQALHIHSEQERLNQLEEQGLWSKERENEITTLTDYVASLEKTKSTQVLPSQLEQLNEQIEKEKAKLYDLLADRSILVSATAEQFASKKVNEIYMFSNLFSDEACNTPLFTQEEFDNLEIEELGSISIELRQKLGAIDDLMLKHIALSVFLQNTLSLAGESVVDFFGQPAIKLTTFQSDLLIYGRFFKHILSNSAQIPQHIIGDPDKLIDWHKVSENASNLMKKTMSGNVAIMGATTEDLKQIAGKDDTILSISEATGNKTKMRGAEFMKVLMG